MAIDNAPTSAQYLTDAWRAIAESSASSSPVDRFERAQVAAIRAASAVIADESLADRVHRCAKSGDGSLWRLLGRCVPELTEWADFFEAMTRLRSSAHPALRAVRAGAAPVSERLADDLLRDADRFTHEVRAWLLRRRTKQVHVAVVDMAQ